MDWLTIFLIMFVAQWLMLFALTAVVCCGAGSTRGRSRSRSGGRSRSRSSSRSKRSKSPREQRVRSPHTPEGRGSSSARPSEADVTEHDRARALALGVAGWSRPSPKTPAPPPAFIYTASIHPSIHPSTKHTNRNHAYPSSTVSRKQSRQANQKTNAPKSNMFLPVHDPSITVCAFSKSKQTTSQAGRTNQHTNQRKWGKKERVATKLCFPQMMSILALHWWPTKQPTNQATKTTQPGVFPKGCRYLVCVTTS